MPARTGVAECAVRDAAAAMLARATGSSGLPGERLRRVMAAFEREFWQRLVDGALPTRRLDGEREAVVRTIVDCISEWSVVNMGPHVERVREIANLFDQWQRTTEKVGMALEKLGIGDARGRYQAESDAYVIYMRAMDGLRRWQRLYRPKDRDAVSAALVKNLKRVCCGADRDDPETRNGHERGAGMSEAELDTLLQRIVDSGHLPGLEVKGLSKRKDTTRPGGVATRPRSSSS
jgi:hypothetical protein